MSDLTSFSNVLVSLALPPPPAIGHNEKRALKRQQEIANAQVRHSQLARRVIRGDDKIKFVKGADGRYMRPAATSLRWRALALWKRFVWEFPRQKVIKVARAVGMPIPDSSKAVLVSVGSSVIGGARVTRLTALVLFMEHALQATSASSIGVEGVVGKGCSSWVPGVLVRAHSVLGMSFQCDVWTILVGIVICLLVWLAACVTIELTLRSAEVFACVWNWTMSSATTWTNGLKNYLNQKFSVSSVPKNRDVAKSEIDFASLTFTGEIRIYRDASGKEFRFHTNAAGTKTVNAVGPSQLRAGLESAQRDSKMAKAVESPKSQFSIFVDDVYRGQGFRYKKFAVSAEHNFATARVGSKVLLKCGKSEFIYTVPVSKQKNTPWQLSTPFPDVALLKMSDSIWSKLGGMTSVEPAFLAQHIKSVIHIVGALSGDGPLLTSSGVAVVKDGIAYHAASTESGFSGAPGYLRSPYEKNPKCVLIHQSGSKDLDVPNEGFPFWLVAQWIDKFLYKTEESSEEYFKKWMQEHYDEVEDRLREGKYFYDPNSESYYFTDVTGRKITEVTQTEVDMMSQGYDQWSRDFDALYGRNSDAPLEGLSDDEEEEDEGSDMEQTTDLQQARSTGLVRNKHRSDDMATFESAEADSASETAKVVRALSVLMDRLDRLEEKGAKNAKAESAAPPLSKTAKKKAAKAAALLEPSAPAVQVNAALAGKPGMPPPKGASEGGPDRAVFRQALPKAGEGSSKPASGSK